VRREDLISVLKSRLPDRFYLKEDEDYVVLFYKKEDGRNIVVAVFVADYVAPEEILKRAYDFLKGGD